MQDEIGALAGAIWHALNAKGELTVRKLKKEVGVTRIELDWAVGWLAREGKIAIRREKHSFHIRLTEPRTQAAAD